MKHRSVVLAAVMSAFALFAVLAVPAAAAPKNSGPVTYEATLTNTSSQYLTPANYAAHGKDVELFSLNQPASSGVQAVAENGDVPALAGEIATAVDANGLGVSGVGGGGPIAPGESVTFEFTTSEDRISIVSMLICTNDGFAGLDSKKLPQQGNAAKNYTLQGYDAGTEINTEQLADIVPAPFCQLGSGLGTGATNPALAEDGVIKRHRTLQGNGTIDAKFDWTGPVAELSIVRK